MFEIRTTCCDAELTQVSEASSPRDLAYAFRCMYCMRTASTRLPMALPCGHTTSANLSFDIKDPKNYVIFCQKCVSQWSNRGSLLTMAPHWKYSEGL